MKVLCLHGRGSNNEIFQMQTASFRADLDDFQWEFVQGTIAHTEGNWSLYTSAFSKHPLYAYYNPIDPTSILQTEEELRSIIEDEGPFDGVMGYSAGALLAAQIMIKDSLAHPFKQPDERPFRFAIFINGPAPLHVFKVSDVEVQNGDEDGEGDSSEFVKEAERILLRRSALQKKSNVTEEDQPDQDAIVELLAKLKARRLANGTPFATDGTYGFTRFEEQREKILIDVPTLHVRSPGDKLMDCGDGLFNMCNPTKRLEFHHRYGHDFPRGRVEMKKIAQLIRELADSI